MKFTMPPFIWHKRDDCQNDCKLLLWLGQKIRWRATSQHLNILTPTNTTTTAKQ
jgi:hypothetical protein